MKKSVITAIILFSLSGLALPVVASAAETRIGFVDYNKLMQESPQGKAETDRARLKFKSRQDDLISEQDKIQSLQDKISKNGAVMSASQLSDNQSELSQLQRDFDRKKSDLEDDENIERNSIYSRLQRDISQAVQEFAKKNNYNLIVGYGIVYADDTVDVTAQVLAQMQKDYQPQGAKSGK